MRVLQVHNFYQQPGGEDQVCAAEYELLTSRGHMVRQYFAHNTALHEVSGLSAAAKTIWNSETYRAIRGEIERAPVDLIHAHNTFPIVSPALYYAAAAEHVPVIQTLHNYRLLCSSATFFREGHVCEQCLGSVVPYQGVLHACYRNNRAASAVTASMLSVHRFAGTWRTKIRTYIALTNFARKKFIEGGLPAGKVAVKPNFLARDPGMGDGEGDYALFAGRICEEKGIRTLLSAWERLGSAIQLKMAGDGPLGAWVRERAAVLPGVEWLGQCDHDSLMQLAKRAKFLVFPSLYYEGLPVTIIEALGCGTPVIASRLGSMNEVVTDGVNGFHFEAGNADDLAAVVRAVLAEPARLGRMRRRRAPLLRAKLYAGAEL